MNNTEHDVMIPPPRSRGDVDAEEERENTSHYLQTSSVPTRGTSLDLSTMSDNFNRPLPKVTFEYLRKRLIMINECNATVRRGRDDVNDADEQWERHDGGCDEDVLPVDRDAPIRHDESVRRSRDDVDADEQRERHGGDGDEDVPSIDQDAPRTYDMSRYRSSATDVRGSNLECPDKESEDPVEATTIFAPEDRQACEKYDLHDSTRPADTKRGTPSHDVYCDVERDIAERCGEVDASDARPIWAVKLKRYPDGHINEANA